MSGASVTFTAPASGASAAFGGAAAVKVATNGSGVATAAAPTANGVAGSYAVSATLTGYATPPVSFSLTNVPKAQVTSGSGTLNISPTPIRVCDGTGLGIATLTWTTTAQVTATEVHLDSPSGALFSRIGPNGSKATGKWVSQGRLFYLQDVSGGLPLTPANTLAMVTAQVTTAGCGSGTIAAVPNPIQVCDGTGLGTTTLTWTTAGGVTATQVRIGSPSGSLFTSIGPNGSKTTGKWVSDGMTFYLQDVSGGLLLTAANTLATVSVSRTSSGCVP